MRHLVTAAFLAAATLATPAKAAVDSCVVGTWWVEISDLADLMTLQMGGRATALGGDARMDVSASGDIRITVRNLQFRVAVPDVPSTVVTINGTSAGRLDANAGVWDAFIPEYNLTGSADVLGQTMTIPFTSASGMFGGGLGGYWCSATQLIFESDPSLPPRFARTWKRG